MREYNITKAIPEDHLGVNLILHDVVNYKSSFVAGGYIRYLLSPHNILPEDIDIFPNSDNEFKELYGLLVDYNFLLVNESRHSTHWNFPGSIILFNLIKPLPQFKIENAESIIDEFDFTVCCAAMISPIKAITNDSFMVDEGSKRLKIHKMRSPLAILSRLDKYLKKGYSISSKEWLKVLDAYDKLPEARKERYKELSEKVTRTPEEHSELLELIYD